MNLPTALGRPKTVAAFTYQPLTASGSLRLLKALPDTLDGFIQIELEEITESTPYHCLSYTWGDQTARLPIRLDGQAAHVERNLYDFVKVAMRHFPGETLWVDALCINQNDDHEKSSQVQRMGSIYQDATDVIIWLGDHEGISRLFEWLGKPQHMVSRALRHLSSDMPPAHLRKYIPDLAYHPYWTRAWVQQEMSQINTIVMW